MRVSLGIAGCLLLVGLGACGPHVEGHAVATRTAADGRYIDASAVRVSVLQVPAGAGELGIVQAHTVGGSIEDAMPEFREQVASLGGDFGKVNEVSTSFEMTMRTRTESYNCGTSDKPRNCTRTVMEQVELATTRILGKAYRLGMVKPKAEPAPAPEPALEMPQPPSAPAEAAPADSGPTPL